MSRSVNEVAALLLNVYLNGSDTRQGIRISRSTLRDLFEMSRLEAVTLRKLHDDLRREGFLLFPLDVDECGLAQTWLLDRSARLENWPLADRSVINRAAARALERA